jgi:hypothetical protein
MKRRQNPNQDIIEFKWCWVTVRDTKSVYTKGPMSPSGQNHRFDGTAAASALALLSDILIVAGIQQSLARLRRW